MHQYTSKKPFISSHHADFPPRNERTVNVIWSGSVTYPSIYCFIWFAKNQINSNCSPRLPWVRIQHDYDYDDNQQWVLNVRHYKVRANLPIRRPNEIQSGSSSWQAWAWIERILCSCQAGCKYKSVQIACGFTPKFQHDFMLCHFFIQTD